MISKEERDAIRARVEAATKGPWEAGLYESVSLTNGVKLLNTHFQRDAEFIAHARQDVPALLDALDELEVDRDCWKARANKAEKTLTKAGYKDNGGELWKPPLGKAPDFDMIDHWKARAEALERAFKDYQGGCENCIHHHQSENKPPCNECDDGDFWQFDMARFAEPERTGGDE